MAEAYQKPNGRKYKTTHKKQGGHHDKGPFPGKCEQPRKHEQDASFDAPSKKKVETD